MFKIYLTPVVNTGCNKKKILINPVFTTSGMSSDRFRWVSVPFRQIMLFLGREVPTCAMLSVL